MIRGRYRRLDRSRLAASAPAHLAYAGRTYPDSDRIIDTIRQPLIVLDEKLRVISANRAFYRAFAVTREETVGRHLAAAGDHRLDVSVLHGFLDLIQVEGAIIGVSCRASLCTTSSVRAVSPRIQCHPISMEKPNESIGSSRNNRAADVACLLQEMSGKKHRGEQKTEQKSKSIDGEARGELQLRADGDLTQTQRHDLMKPLTGAAVREHRNAVRDRSESLSAFSRNGCPQSWEPATGGSSQTKRKLRYFATGNPVACRLTL
jgi:PAS fold